MITGNDEAPVRARQGRLASMASLAAACDAGDILKPVARVPTCCRAGLFRKARIATPVNSACVRIRTQAGRITGNRCQGGACRPRVGRDRRRPGTVRDRPSVTRQAGYPKQ